jgi:hypothetical protein
MARIGGFDRTVPVAVVNLCRCMFKGSEGAGNGPSVVAMWKNCGDGRSSVRAEFIAITG